MAADATPIERQWRDAFMDALGQSAQREPLREAALAEDLMAWTAALTVVVAESFSRCGWSVAAKQHRATALPMARQEYLGIDVMAFQAGTVGDASATWRWPAAAAELENSTTDRAVAYSLWKVLCVQARLRIVFAYRRDWEAGRGLVRELTESVVRPLWDDAELAPKVPVLIALGSRGEGETFPHGYFKFWKLDTNVREFAKF